MINKFKDNWNAIDELCPHCNSVTKKAIGINKQNLKRLFFTKPSLNDIMIMFMIIAILLMAYSYFSEISAYREIINNPGELCLYYYHNMMVQGTNEYIDLNNITIVNGNGFG
uniref:Uncharacterized protein n=1 Tax=viral metagenome TaxID=1070528 RepID=A0A6M3LQT5_9ZZZZ